MGGPGPYDAAALPKGRSFFNQNRTSTTQDPLTDGAAAFFAKDAGVSRSGRERKRPKR